MVIFTLFSRGKKATAVHRQPGYQTHDSTVWFATKVGLAFLTAFFELFSLNRLADFNMLFRLFFSPNLLGASQLSELEILLLCLGKSAGTQKARYLFRDNFSES